MARRKYRARMAMRFANRTRVVGNARITIQPAHNAQYGFRACIKFGRQKMLDGGRVPNEKCAYGRNPRKAIASAMRFFAKSIGGRKGAFARYSR